MQAITSQVESLVQYKGETFDAINQEYDSIKDRIEEGVQKMKESNVFTDSEIKQVRDFAINLLGVRYRETKDTITKNMRESFQF